MGSERERGRSGAFSRFILHAGVPVAIVLGAYALASASVPHMFKNGDTLQAADLNVNFSALDQRVAAIELAEPFAGTYPAVMGRGEHANAAGTLPTLSANTWFCGVAPDHLFLSSAPLTPNEVKFSNAFGSILFTNAGAISLNLDPPIPLSTCGPMTTMCPPCPTKEMCGEPITFFLISKAARSITVTNFLDNAGSFYVDGTLVASHHDGLVNKTTFPIPAGPFALSFLACSTDGPTIAFVIYDAFLTNPEWGLTIDYDRIFHRKNK
jgi:hypothetical protein